MTRWKEREREREREQCSAETRGAGDGETRNLRNGEGIPFDVKVDATHISELPSLVVAVFFPLLATYRCLHVNVDELVDNA